MVIPVVVLLVGLGLLVWAADAFVVGAEGLAVRLQWPPVVIGAVVVGFGTSLPELTTSVVAAWAGEPDLALGNAAGSNVANLLLVLGVAALVRPVRVVGPRTDGRDTLLAVLAGLALLGLALDGRLGPIDAAVLVAVLAGAVGWQIAAGRGQHLEATAWVTPRAGQALVGRLVVGLVGVLAGAQALVWGARVVAEELGVPSIVIGSLLVAVGTSLPELATAIASARRGQAELLLGNLLGSNTFNALAVVGASALVGAARGTPVVVADPALAVVGVAAVVTAVVGPLVWWRRGIGRGPALGLVAAYAASVPALLAIS